MKNSVSLAGQLENRVTAHALHVGDRINTTGFEGEALSAVPLAIRIGQDGIAVRSATALRY
jgi:required for meiotic nuclear division protein 1